MPWMIAVVSITTLPFAELVAANLRSPLSTMVAVLWLVTVTMGAGFVGLVWRLSGAAAARRTATFLVPLLWLFFHHPMVAATLDTAGFRDSDSALAWGAIAAAAAAAMVVLSRRRVVQTYVAVFSVASLVVPLVAVLAGSGTSPATQLPTGEPLETGPFRHTPNVYYFVVDGYPRADVVTREAGLQIDPFVDHLESQGFVVSDSALANYPTTFLSLASTLSTSYVVDEFDPLGDFASYYDLIRGDNPVVATFTASGYRYVHSYSWDTLACAGHEALCIGDGGLIDESVWGVVRSTPLSPVVEGLTDPTTLLRRYADPVTATDRVLADPTLEPFFLFAHLLQPHPPHVWHADCSTRPTRWQATYWRDPGAFAGTVACLNQRLTTAVDAIVDKDPHAIIAIQGDHGAAFGEFDWHEMSDRDLAQRMPVLSAIRLPTRCRDSVPDDLTPVNTFRLVFACLADQDPVLLDNRHYWGQYGFDHVERINEERLSRLNPP